MSSSPEDRATREIEELRRLFAKPVRRVTSEPDQAPEAGPSSVDPERTQAGSPGPADADQDAGPLGPAEEPDGEGLEADATGSAQTPDAADTGDQSSPSEDRPPPDEPAPRRPTGSVSSRTLAVEHEPEAPLSIREEGDGDQREQDALERPARRLVPLEPSPPPSGQPRPRRRAGRAVLAAVIVLAVAAAFGLGTWLGQGLQGDRGSAGAAVTPTVDTQSVQAATTASAPPAALRDACLETAQLADRVIDLLVADKRGRELDPLLRAYGQASQRCRAAANAGPTP
jgi:hypothetical protein